MNMHKNARTTPHLRAFFVQRMSVRTVYKWLKRNREEGAAGLHGRSSRPHCLRQPTSPEVEAD